MTASPTEIDPAWIVAQRPPRSAGLDPFQPYAVSREQERAASGQILSSATIFLANKECPWRCLMCDLWKNTLTKTVPPGAIPKQIEVGLARLGERPDQLKLYNSGSFFDAAAIPPREYPEIARRVAGVGRIIVESHPRLVGDKARRMRDLLTGSFEVAMGLETIHPEVLPRLNKRSRLADFSRAAEFLRAADIGVRAFVLVKPPFLTETEGVEWAVKSAAFAYASGAEVVSLIPTRGGNGAMERLSESNEFAPPRLAALETTLAEVLALKQGRIFADTWDLATFSRCPVCFERRRQRLEEINLTQIVSPAIDCKVCGGT